MTTETFGINCMKAKISGQVQHVSGFPPRVIKKRPQALSLPTPAAVRNRAALDYWRDRLWRSRHKFLVLLGPQYRELMRKIIFSMEKAELPGMVPHLMMGTFAIWFFTGSVQKMEEFIVAVFNGKVFLVDRRLFLIENTPTDLPKDELITRVLLYDPVCHPEGCGSKAALEATRFLTLLGTPPAEKPWIQEWMSEMQTARGQAAAEIGEEAADALWAEVTCARKSGHADRESKNKNQEMTQKVSYW